MSGSAFPATLNLAALSLTQGVVYSPTAGSAVNLGSIGGAGDVNGDGFDDILVGSFNANGQRGFGSLILGSASGWTNLNLQTASPPAVYDLNGATGLNRTGSAVAGAGDVNGDGLADFIVTATFATAAGRSGAGIAYVVFGKTAGWADTDLTSFTGGSSGGYQILGPTAGAQFGSQVAKGLGDVNGDGFADIYVLANTSSGASFGYVVYGKSGGANNVSFSNLDLATATTAQAFRVDGPTTAGVNNTTIGTAGDINGDGYADFAWGNFGSTVGGFANAGTAYVGFGGTALGNMDFNNPLPSGAGFKISGAATNNRLGLSINSAGDVNGDGITDLLVGGASVAYLIFGHTGAWSDINVGSLTPSIGVSFRMSEGDFGAGVSAAGDVNGDGYADIMITRPSSTENGLTTAGSVYLVYGKSAGWANVDFNTTAPDSLIQGAVASGRLGSLRNVAELGDIDGDGFGDIGVGAVNANSSEGLGYALFSQSTGNVTNFGTTLADGIRGGAGNDALSGGAGGDSITGGAGDDTIDGGAGNDTMDGGAGNDTLSYASATANVTLSLAVTTAQNTGGAGTDTATNFENLTGGAGNDSLTGNAGDNVIEGGAGNDTLDGGAGNDTVSYAGASAAVQVGLNAQTIALDTGGAGIDTLFNFENLIGSAFGDRLSGVSNGSSVISGGGGDDLIEDGNSLNDTLDGGPGNDYLNSFAGNDVIIGGAGTDDLNLNLGTANLTFSLLLSGPQAAFGRTLTVSGIENLFSGGGNDSLTGDAGANTIRGGAGNDTIDGAGGADELDGQTGIDTVTFASASAGVIVYMNDNSFVDPASGLFGRFVSFESLIGGAFNDSVSGSTDNDAVNGAAGNDTIDGGAGNDTLNGGADIDTLSYASATANVSVSLALTTAQNTGGAGTDTILNFENLTGGAGNDSLTGDGGNNVIRGGNGNDTIRGGGGDDTIEGGAGDDLLDGAAGIDTLTYASATIGVVVSLAEPFTSGGAGHDIISNFENLIGGVASDILGGSDAANIIQGGGGDDLIEGGLGNDTLDGGAGTSDSVTYYTATANVVANLVTGLATGGAGNDVLSNFENLSGGAGNDSLTGDDGANILQGGAGNDTINGAAGNDSINGEAGDDLLVGGEGIDTVLLAATTGVVASLITGLATGGTGNDTFSGFENLFGGAGNDSLIGDAGNNELAGSEGDDTIEGGAGNDRLNGGAGNDTLNYATATGNITINLALNTAQNAGDAGTDTVFFFETLIGGAGNDSLTGTIVANSIAGGAGHDTIDGGLGNDTLDGGTGNDTLSYTSATTSLTVSLAAQGGAQVTGGSGTDTASNFENLTGGGGNDSLTGDGGNNVIQGGGGNDTIVGGAGNDTLDGGTETDTLSYAAATDGVTVSLVLATAQVTGGAGTDTVSNFENLTGGAGNDSLTGNGGANIIGGGGGSDTIDGGAGNDTLDGGADNDTLSYASANAGVTISLALTTAQVTGGSGTDTVSNFENLTGSAGNDRLTGDAGNNVIEGRAGNDTLDGGAGIDTLSYAWATTGIFINLTQTTAQTPYSPISIYVGMTNTISGFENLVGGSDTDVMAGDGHANVISGGAGDDQLNGGGGNDTIDGGLGNDIIESDLGDDLLTGGAGVDLLIYATAPGAVTVSLALTTAQATGGAGTDMVTGFEDLTGSVYNDSLTGDGGDNFLNGNNGDDTIEGGAGNDTMSGEGGNNTLSYASATSNIVFSLALFTAQNTGGAGIDTAFSMQNLVGGAGNDSLTGSTDNNIIQGGAGNDTLVGGTGNDTIDGGAGSDLAQFSGSQASYRIGVRDGVVLISGADGVDQFVNVESFQWGEAASVSLAAVEALDTGLVYVSLDGGTGRFVLPDPYTGPVPGLVNQLLTGPGNDVVLGTETADFINAGTGDDAIDGGAGNDVIDGGTGSNFVTGGAGVDTFFIDRRGAIAGSVWNTITDWTAGEQVSLFGWTPGTSQSIWVANDGVAGWKGATLHADIDGNGLIDTSLTFTGRVQAELPVPFEFPGLLWFV